jgi:hypothetical protein
MRSGFLIFSSAEEHHLINIGFLGTGAEQISSFSSMSLEDRSGANMVSPSPVFRKAKHRGFVER